MTSSKARLENHLARRHLRAFLPFSRSQRQAFLLVLFLCCSAVCLPQVAAAPKKKKTPETKAPAKVPEVKRKADNPILFSGDEAGDRSIGYDDRAAPNDTNDATEQPEQVAPSAATSTAGGTFVGLDFNRRFDATSAVNTYVAETENGLADMIEAKKKISGLLEGAKRQNLVVTVNLLQSNIDAIDEIQAVATRYAKELKKMVDDNKSRREIYFQLRSFRNLHTRASMLRSEAIDYYERSTGSEFIEVEYLGEAKDYTSHGSVDESEIDDESLVLGNDTIAMPESDEEEEQ